MRHGEVACGFSGCGTLPRRLALVCVVRIDTHRARRYFASRSSSSAFSPGRAAKGSLLPSPANS